MKIYDCNGDIVSLIVAMLDLLCEFLYYFLVFKYKRGLALAKL